jgi:hypothetical protein
MNYYLTEKTQKQTYIFFPCSQEQLLKWIRISFEKNEKFEINLNQLYEIQNKHIVEFILLKENKNITLYNLLENIKIKYPMLPLIHYNNINKFTDLILKSVKYDRRNILSSLQDKIKYKKLLQYLGINNYLKPLCIFSTPIDNIDDIKIKHNLPNLFIIKANNGCGWNIRVTDNVITTYNEKSIHYKIEENDVFDLTSKWLNSDYSTEEWVYTQINPRLVFVEPIINIKYELFVYYIKDKVTVFRSLNDEHTTKRTSCWYTKSWDSLLNENEKTQHLPYPKPLFLNNILSECQKIIDYVNVEAARIDLFITEDNYYFSEFTCYPVGGNCPDNFIPINKYMMEKCKDIDREPFLKDYWQLQMKNCERDEIKSAIINKSFLEIGSGFSTLYFAQFVDKMVSVECRSKWFNIIQNMLCNNSRVDMKLFHPEPCAYDAHGNEKWIKREDGTSDYGTKYEFLGYLKGIGLILDSINFNVILVDGNCRKEVIEMLISRNYTGIIFLNDVCPERNYLNNPIFSLPKINVLYQIDSLVRLTIT